MHKIASPQDLQAEIHNILAFIRASERPSRQVIALKFRELADRVAADPTKEGVKDGPLAKADQKEGKKIVGFIQKTLDSKSAMSQALEDTKNAAKSLGTVYGAGHERRKSADIIVHKSEEALGHVKKAVEAVYDALDEAKKFRDNDF
jgi:hypothetical protein